MIGWVQSVAFAVVIVALIIAITEIIHRKQKYRHKERMKKLEQDHEIVTGPDK